MEMGGIKLPEVVNQTFIGLVIGLVGIYFFIPLEIQETHKIIGLKLLVTYSIYMAVLSCVQMYKNTRRYWHKEKLENKKLERGF